MRVLSAFLFLSLVIFARAENYEIGLDGSTDALSHRDKNEVLVEIRNACGTTISIFWGSPTDESSFMFDMVQTDRTTLSTFHGHQFFAKFSKDNAEFLEDFSVDSSTKKFTFCSDGNDGQDVPDNLDSPVTIMGTRSSSLTAKFRCLCSGGVDYYYDDGHEGSFQGSLLMGSEVSTNSYEGHTFFFTEKGNKGNEIARFLLTKDTVLHLVIDKKNPPPSSYLEHAEVERKFTEDYHNRTGLVWRHYYGPNGPRAAPQLHMWSAPSVGYKHTVNSEHGFWNCSGSAATCQSKSVKMELVVASATPKVFTIASFLSSFECDEIVRLAKPEAKDSMIGDFKQGGASVSSTRTSKNSWLPRTLNTVMETLSLRAADLMNIDEALLHTYANSEDLQVVHYSAGQKYDPHNDWSGSKSESRFLTLLLYLNDMDGPDAGGETSFPKGAEGRGFKVTPRRGSAVLFYNLLEDGNGDDLALHAALPVTSGEKWAANFWVWDPKR